MGTRQIKGASGILSKKKRRIIGGTTILSTAERESKQFLQYVEEGNVVKVRECLSRGADLTVKNSAGYTVLMIATYKHYKEIVEMLIAAKVDVNVKASDGNTALMIAIDFRKTNIAKLLVDAGADLKGNNIWAISALLDATKRNEVEIVKLLIAAKADLSENGDGGTALISAAMRGYKEIAKMLIAAGANVNAKTSTGNTALIFAAEGGHKEIVEMLIAAKADLTVTGSHDDTALMVAAGGGYKEIVEMLIDAKADVNVKTPMGNTALILAAGGGHREIVEMLIAAKADLNVKGVNGQTALEIAKQEGHDEIVDLIEFVLGIPKEMWAGWSRPDIAYLDSIFSRNGQEAVDNSSCPVCLRTNPRGEGCVYIQGHNCSKLQGFYHKALYNKYKKADGCIEWCTICGRICSNHQHYRLGDANGAKPVLLPKTDPFTKDCSLSAGGGGLMEKLSRFRRLREFALELQSQIGKIPKKKALEMLVEAMWDAPLVNNARLPGIMAEGKWNIPSNAFPLPRANNPEVNMATFPNIKKPADEKQPELLKGENTLTWEENVDVIKFYHTKQNGQPFPHTNFISKLSLQNFIRGQVATFGANPDFGLCWETGPDGCNGRLYPEEIEQFFEDTTDAAKDAELKKLFNDYRVKFNYKFGAGNGMGGGRMTRRRQAKRRQAKRGQEKRGGGNIANVFVPATNAQCNIRPRNNTRKRSNK